MPVPAVPHAWRSWKSDSGVAALAALAFAVGIGSATAIYTVVDAVALRRIPYAGGERFVAVYGGRISEPGQRSAHTFPDLQEYEQRTRSFDVFGWFRPASFNLSYAGQPQHVDGVLVTPSLAHHLGVRPRIGGWFQDDTSVVISSGLWRRLGADPAIVGRPLALDGRTYTIAGVMPADFRLPMPGPGVERLRSDVWLPLDPAGKGQPRSEGMFFCYARLKPGVTLEQAREDVSRVAGEIAAGDPAAHPSYTAIVDDLAQAVILTIRPTLLLLVGAAALLLLITCADVAGLLLARSVARARDTAVRIALGAGQGQLALQYFVEALIVALPGAALGVLLALALVRAVVTMAAEHIPRADEIAVDSRVLAFSLLTAFVASALASLAPLWQAARTAPADVLNEGVRSTAGSRTRRLSEWLVMAEIALAFTLLSSAAMLLVHARGLSRVDPGFDPLGLLTFHLTAAEPREDTPAARAAARARWIAAIEAVPGVTSVGYANQLPLAGCCLSVTMYAEGRSIESTSVQRTSLMAVSPGYFRTMRIQLRSGRFLDERDISDEALVGVVNEAAAAAYWPDRPALGAYGRFGSPDGTRFQVVGVVGNVRNDGLGKPPVPEVYLSGAIVSLNPLRFVVRSSLPPATLIPAVRETVRSVDPLQPIHAIAMMSDIARGSLSFERIASFLVGFFALAALLMATLGIYGVVSYSVRRGTVEIGTRMALGAVPRDLLKLIVGRGLRMTGYGAAAGGLVVIGAASALMRAFEIRDPGVLPFAAATAVVAMVAAGASFFPAWRATRIPPMVAIRNEPEPIWREVRARLRLAASGIAQAISPATAPRALAFEVLTEFVGAARAASSFPEAFQRALATLCDRLGATAGHLLELGSEGTDGNSVRVCRVLASVPEGRPSRLSLPPDGFLARRLSSYPYPLPFGSADLDAWLHWAGGVSAAYTAELEQLKESGTVIAVGLQARGGLIGMLLLGPRHDRVAYGDEERQVLRHAGDQLTLMIENARLTVRVLEQEKLRRDLALAAEVQKRLLPEGAPPGQAAALAAVSLPARSIGGDYYDFLDLGGHRIGIALADIAGKGIAAALIMAVVQASLRIVASDGTASLPELAARMNDLLHRSTRSNSYATFFYAQMDEQSRRLRYVNAGHNPPYLLRPVQQPAGAGQEDRAGASAIEELGTGGTVIGLFPEMSYEEGTVQLQAGDVIVAFTDGVPEALNEAGEEFGEARLKELLRQILHLTAPEIAATLTGALRSWIGGAPQYDDLTVVVIKTL
ncbi:MAG TPA: ADOP family duplicated permease [Vicinamibacterales bacterium]|nr:ADOP family duplicated permease [Vicinamibacterales bacterium]